MKLTSLLLATSAAAAEIIGGALLLLRPDLIRRSQYTLLALGAGFVLALVFMELIPQSFALIGHSAALWIVLGYAMIHVVEHTIVGHFHFGEESHSHVLSRVASYSTIAGLAMHAFFDGFVIAASVAVSRELGVLVFAAVLLHKVPEGFTVASVMIASDHKRRATLVASVSIGVATIFGALLVPLLTTIDSTLTGVAFAFSAGVAVYVGASDLVPEINHSGSRFMPVVVLIGMLVFYGSAEILHRFLQ